MLTLALLACAPLLVIIGICALVIRRRSSHGQTTTVDDVQLQHRYARAEVERTQRMQYPF